MLQWFISLPEFDEITELNENSALFRKNSIEDKNLSKCKNVSEQEQIANRVVLKVAHQYYNNYITADLGLSLLHIYQRESSIL